MTETLRRIGLVYAMEAEARPLLEALGLKPASAWDSQLPMKTYEGSRGKLSLTVVVAGPCRRDRVDNIGSNAATLGTYLLIEKFAPQLILNPGTAGAFQKKGAKIGEVYLGQGDVRFHDRHISIPIFEKYAVGYYPVQAAPNAAAALGLRRGIVSSGNSLDATDFDLKRLASNEADLKEMEAAAIGWVAWLKGVPFLPVKAVTDFVDHPSPTAQQFYANYLSASQRLSEVTLGLLDFLSGKTLDSL